MTTDSSSPTRSPASASARATQQMRVREAMKPRAELVQRRVLRAAIGPSAAHMMPGGVAAAIEYFRGQHAKGVFPGGQFVVRRRGLVVIDEAVGVARGLRADEGEPPLAFTRERRSALCSAGKPLVALAIALLEDRGLVRVERPVADYWPEFAQSGKAAISVLDVLLHRSGLSLQEIERDWRGYRDWSGIMQRISALSPKFPRGALAYQPMGFGWILGELVRRVSGKPIERFLEQDLLAPAGLDDLRLGVPVREVPTLARSYWLDAKPPILGGQPMLDFERAQNSQEQLCAVLPGAGTIGTARALARFYEWLLSGAKSLTGAPLIRPETLARYVTRQVSGVDRTVRVPMVLGRGFALGWLWPHPYGWWNTGRCFGHAGNFSTLAWADPTTGCAIAIVTNGNRAPSRLLGRFAPIASLVRGACRTDSA